MCMCVCMCSFIIDFEELNFAIYIIFVTKYSVSVCSTREGKPFTAIVDGANIAYYMQNFEGGTFNFHQIKFMVEALEKMNENPLVVLPHKYSSKSFHISMGASRRRQVVTNKEREILDT